MTVTRRILISFAAVCLPVSLLAAPAAAGRSGPGTGATLQRTVVDLGAGGVGQVRRVGNAVVVVGSVEVNGIEHAASWTYTGSSPVQPVDLTSWVGGIRSAASGVDTSGTVVGWMQESSGAQHNFRLTQDRKLAFFDGTPPATSPTGNFLAGSLAGSAVRWSGTSTPSATVLDSGTGTNASGVNDAGVAVGSVGRACTIVSEPYGCSDLVVWTSPTSRRELAPPAGWGAVYPSGVAAGASPLAVGYGYTGSATLAFSLSDAAGSGTPVVLPVPAPRRGAPPASRALAVSDTGLVVGHVGALAAQWTQTGGSWQYTNVSGVASASGWTLNDARTIDSQGDMAGAGVHNGNGQHAYLVLP